MSEEPVSNKNHTDRTLMQSTMVRLALAVAVIGIVLVVVGVIAFFSYRANRNKPLEVKVYPGAALVNEERLYDGFDHQQYVSTDPFEEIEAFYDRQDDMECERQYRVVEDRPGQEPLKEDVLFTRCQIDHSGLGMTQYTSVVIQPAFDDNQNPTGQIIIDVQRHWGS